MSTSKSQSDYQNSDSGQIVLTIDQSDDGDDEQAIIADITRDHVWIAMPAANAPVLFDWE